MYCVRYIHISGERPKKKKERKNETRPSGHSHAEPSVVAVCGWCSTIKAIRHMRTRQMVLAAMHYACVGRSGCGFGGSEDEIVGAGYAWAEW